MPTGVLLDTIRDFVYPKELPQYVVLRYIDYAEFEPEVQIIICSNEFEELGLEIEVPEF